MGGNAFKSTLSSTAFPRLPPAVYHALKTRIQPLLEGLYEHVCVPYEAPEKRDYGDLDLMVYLPRRRIQTSGNLASNDGTSVDVSSLGIDEGDVGNRGYLVNVPHDVVATALGAEHVNPMEGNRTSNFAIPIKRGEWGPYGHETEEVCARSMTESGEIFYQVDINVCESRGEWERRATYSAYGDLGMILGLIAKNAGLHLGHKGLKYPDIPNAPIILSESFDDICSFFGWSTEVWKNGFQTKLACYEWATSSKYFDLARFKAQELDSNKKKDRTMYSGFFEWVGNLSQQNPASAEGEIPDAREAALDFFNKRSILNQRREEQKRKELLKTSFSGTRVRDWTGLGNYWLGVKKIMDGVREEFGGEANIAKVLYEGGEGKVQSVVLDVQKNLGIFSKWAVAGDLEGAGVGVRVN